MAPDTARRLAATLCCALSLPAHGVAAPEQDLARGVALVRDGDFEGAIAPLAAVVQELNADLSRRAALAQAYLYLGVAYLELGQELEARGKFREALRNDPKLKLSSREFSGQVMRVFETERLAAQPPKRRRKLLLPLLLVVGGGAASAGIAVASGGGEPPPTSGAAATTTTTVPSGGGPGPSTTTTTMPGGPGPSTTSTTSTTTLPASTSTTTPTTTVPASTSTTTTSTSTTTTSTTSTTTTTTLPSCTYTLSPDRTFQFGGGNGVCNVSVSPQSCRWNVEVFPGVNWLDINGPTSGTGNGSVNYSVAALQLIGSRSARIRAQQDPGAGCDITQQGLLGVQGSRGLEWESRLEVPGGRGQIVVNGRDVVFQADTALRQASVVRDGLNRVEATLVSADGKPGVWRFDLLAGYEPGSLHVIAGQVRLVGAGSVVFDVSGAAGERLMFAFKAAGRSETVPAPRAE